MGVIGRWFLVSLVSVAAFAAGVWLGGAVVLTPLLASATDRWTVASGIGAVLAASVAAGGQWWVSRNNETVSSDPNAVQTAGGLGQRSISVGRDNTGIASTGDGASNTQQQR
jgi:hypothetical protein